MDKVDTEYVLDDCLRREDVRNLMLWVQGQPHLPQMTEYETIWFLKSCYYSNEQAKITIDKYFSMRTQEQELFYGSTSEKVNDISKIAVLSYMSRKNAEGDSILFILLEDKDPTYFHLPDQIKLLDSIIMTELFLRGTHNGLRFVIDLERATVGHVARLGITHVRKGLIYLQEALPIRLKGIHFINIKPVLEMILAICRPFLSKEFNEMIYLHGTLEDFSKYIPVECLPKEYGGREEQVEKLKVNMLSTLLQNLDFLKHLDSQTVDESKRTEKPNDPSELFGKAGTFKKLQLD